MRQSKPMELIILMISSGLFSSIATKYPTHLLDIMRGNSRNNLSIKDLPWLDPAQALSNIPNISSSQDGIYGGLNINKSMMPSNFNPLIKSLLNTSTVTLFRKAVSDVILQAAGLISIAKHKADELSCLDIAEIIIPEPLPTSKTIVG
uniref:Putative secreted protein n=1 Tax=Panstrongylus lignarius TaxID=156445 RepID=A0A224Y0L0_9HEMI